jgi:hypothetical protein
LSPTPPVLCSRNVGQVHALAGAQHRVRQQARLFGGHAVDGNRHQQRRRLILGDGTRRHTVDEDADLLAGERVPVALSRDDIDETHGRRIVAEAVE